MKIMFTLLVVAFSLPGFCAGLLIEPFAGYTVVQNSGTATISGLKGDVEETDSKGLTYGGRLGYGIGNIGAGVEYLTGTFKDGSAEDKITNLGGFVMADLALVRVWGTYIFSAKDKSKNDDFEGTLEGSGAKLGLGFSILPKVSLNVEYVMMNFDQEEIDGVDAVDIKSQGFVVGLSFPFVF